MSDGDYLRSIAERRAQQGRHEDAVFLLLMGAVLRQPHKSHYRR